MNKIPPQRSSGSSGTAAATMIFYSQLQFALCYIFVYLRFNIFVIKHSIFLSYVSLVVGGGRWWSVVGGGGWWVVGAGGGGWLFWVVVGGGWRPLEAMGSHRGQFPRTDSGPTPSGPPKLRLFGELVILFCWDQKTVFERFLYRCSTKASCNNPAKPCLFVVVSPTVT